MQFETAMAEFPTRKAESRTAMFESETRNTESRTPMFESQTRKAKSRTPMAEFQTPEAEFRTAMAESETWKAESGTAMAESETRNAEFRTAMAESETRKAGSRTAMAGFGTRRPSSQPPCFPRNSPLPSPQFFLICWSMRAMKTIFKDPALQAQFERDGYLVRPLLSAEAVADIRALFTQLHPDNPAEGFYSTTFSDETAFKQQIFERVDKWVGPKVPEHFDDVKKLGASFLLKQPGEPGHMPIHQDWTVSDEENGDFTATIWIPLQDVTAENGAIKVLQGSHRFSNALRGPSLPVIWKEVFPQLEPELKTLEMKAGEAFIFTHNVLHSSHLNQADTPRLAVTYGLAPESTRLMYYWREGGRIERIAMGDDLFMRYHNIGERPSFGVSQGFVSQDLSPVTAEECEAALKSGKRIEREIKRLPGEFKQSVDAPQFYLFPTEALNQLLAQQGYVIFDFLEPDAITRLKDYFYQHHPDSPDKFYASAHVSDTDFRKAMNAEIQSVFQPYLDQYLNKLQALGGSFIAKPKGNRGILPPHADWNISDEREFRSFNLWVPLVDTSPENGAVYILPDSHRWFDSFRGPGIPNCFQPVINEIWDHMVPLNMKAGQALLYDHRLVHGSPQNQTDTLRLACVYGIIPAGAEMRYYRQEGPLLNSYRSNVDFFLLGDPETGPGELESLGSQAYDWPEVDSQQLKAFLGITEQQSEQGNPEEEKGFWTTYTPGNVVREIAHRIKNVFS